MTRLGVKRPRMQFLRRLKYLRVTCAPPRKSLAEIQFELWEREAARKGS